MKKRLAIGLLVSIILLLILVVVFYPKYIGQGGGWGVSRDRVCDCMGLSYDYYPFGCNDCNTKNYCMGFVKNCQCVNASILIFQNLPKILSNNSNGEYNKKFHTNQYIVDNFYYPC